MLGNILEWLTSSEGGAFIVVAWAVSWLLEDVERWHALPSKTRSLIILGLSAVLGVVSVVLQQNPDVVAAIEPYFQPVYYAILAWLTTQGAYKGYKVLQQQTAQ